jgi:PAS domain S-box-containing protein
MSADKSEDHRPRVGSASLPDSQLQSLVQIISRSQQNFRDLIDHLDQAVFTLSLDGEIRVANRRLAEILGVSFQDLIGHRLEEFVLSPSLAEAKRSFSDFVRAGSWEGVVSARFKRDSSLRYFECWLMPVMEEGEPASVNGWARDVTSQHESETRFAELFESLREGIFFSTPDGQVLDANPALVRMLGYDSKKELKAINFREVYDDPSQRQLVVADLERDGAMQDRDIVLRRKDGKRIHCLASGFAIRDASGKVIQLQGTLVDITERLEIEQRLRNEQDFVRRLVANFPDPIAVLDCEGRFTYVSQRVMDAVGYSADMLIGTMLGSRAHPDDRAHLLEGFRAIITGKAHDAQLEYRTAHKDGSWRTFRASAAPQYDESGKITGVVASARDVTESKQFEREVVQKDKFTAMGQMMAGAAHELNNPLTAILGVSELIRERATDDASRRHAEVILTQARRAAGIVQNLLDFARPPAQGRLKLSLEEVVGEALRSSHASLAAKNITVEFKSEPDLPLVAGDKKLLAQIFLNIITNAEQAISSTRDCGTLKISVARVGEKVCVTFTDDGPGISSDMIGKVFDPFFTTKRPGGGSGLGLTICHAVAKEHGGSIEVQSTHGAGATFQVFFPGAAEESKNQPQAVTPPARKSPAAMEGLQGHSLLIIDDEESIREIVEEGLSARGMKVETAGSSEEALSRLASHSYDVLLCDMNLPGLPGDELFRRLRAQAGKSMPHFVFMTGDLLEPSVLNQFADRGVQVMQKPFHVAALAKLLVELLQSQAAARR